MKHFYLFTLLFTITNFLQAQLDTTFQQTKVVETVFEDQQLVDANSHLLNSLMDEKNVFRLGFEGTTLPYYINRNFYSDLPLANSLFLEYEHRIKTGLSIATQLHYNRTTPTTIYQTLILSLSFPVVHNYGFQIEPRWYFKKRKQVNNGKSGNNTSGIYTSLLAGVRYVRLPSPNPVFNDGKNQFLKSQYQYSTLNLGWQQRFGRYGFIHLHLGTGIQHNPQKTITITTPNFIYEYEPISKWRWLTSYKVGVGFAINNKSDTKIARAFWTYRKDDTDMWKIDLFGLLYRLNKTGINGEINIGYEKSIAKSAFSIAANVLFRHQGVLENTIKYNQLNIQLAPRFYYNLKKRIRKGKAANDLSAEYLSVRNQWNFQNEHWSGKAYHLSILWGIQRRVFENMYINYELGRNIPMNVENYISFNELISELKIGIAF